MRDVQIVVVCTKMAATECVEDNKGGVAEGEELPAKDELLEKTAKPRRNGLSHGFTCGDNGGVCVRSKRENVGHCVRLNGMTKAAAAAATENGSLGVDRSISPLPMTTTIAAKAATTTMTTGTGNIVNGGGSNRSRKDRDPPSPNNGSGGGGGGGGARKRRRTLRFDSSESSDSGVAALSSTDTSSQSSGTSDITEPCSPPSPDSPRSCTPLSSCINGFSRSQHCCHNNNNETCTSHQTSCTSLNCEKTHPFQEVSKNCPNSNLFINENKPDKSYLNFCNLQKEISKTNSQSSEVAETFPQKNLHNGVNDYDESEFLLQRTATDDIKRHGVHKVVDFSNNNNNEIEINIKAESLTKDLTKVGEKLTKSKANENVTCQWDECITVMKSGFEVVEHLQNVHVSSQRNSKTFVCLWSGCKVYNRTSSSFTWLERHVLTHAGNKPFQCIVDGCGQRFTSQGGLERHVNSHFNHTCSSNNIAAHSGSNPNSAARRKDDTPTKIVKKKRLRYRRRGWTVKTEDFFDAGMMECVQHHLVTLNSNTKLDLDGTCRSVTFYSTVMAKRTEASGKVRALLHWTPENILADQWILESQVESFSKWTIPLPLIPRDSLALIDPSLNHRYQRLRKNRRK